jgi:hypothetical protein
MALQEIDMSSKARNYPRLVRAEALLHDHVRDVDGMKHGIVVLGHNVAQVRAQREAYGLPGAVAQP